MNYFYIKESEYNIDQELSILEGANLELININEGFISNAWEKLKEIIKSILRKIGSLFIHTDESKKQLLINLKKSFTKEKANDKISFTYNEYRIPKLDFSQQVENLSKISDEKVLDSEKANILSSFRLSLIIANQLHLSNDKNLHDGLIDYMERNTEKKVTLKKSEVLSMIDSTNEFISSERKTFDKLSSSMNTTISKIDSRIKNEKDNKSLSIIKDVLSNAISSINTYYSLLLSHLGKMVDRFLAVLK